MNKIKYISSEKWWSHDILSKDFNVVDNPTKYKCVPSGEYQIRGELKDNAKYYWVLDNIWYLIEDKIKDNGHYLCEAAKYSLFPNLSEKEWDLMNKVPYERLTKYWQRARYGYNFYMELRAIKRRSIKMRIKIIGR